MPPHATALVDTQIPNPVGGPAENADQVDGDQGVYGLPEAYGLQSNRWGDKREVPSQERSGTAEVITVHLVEPGPAEV